MAQQEMSFAHALTEARQIIIQQANRIKADGDKIKVLQQQLADQADTLAETEKTLKEHQIAAKQQATEMLDLRTQLTQATTAREQIEAMVNRQGERIQQLQSQAGEMERAMNQLSNRIAELSKEREALVHQVPSKEDTDALAALSMLLSSKKAPAIHSDEPMRLQQAA